MCAFYNYHYNNLKHLSKKNISIKYIKFDNVNKNLNEFINENFTDIQICCISEKHFNKSDVKYYHPLRFRLSGKQKCYMYCGYTTLKNKYMLFDIERKIVKFKHLTFTVINNKNIKKISVDFNIKFTEYGWMEFIKFIKNYFTHKDQNRELLSDGN